MAGKNAWIYPGHVRETRATWAWLLCPCNWWIDVLPLLFLGDVKHNSSQRNDSNYSEEVEALTEASIMFVITNSQRQSRSGKSIPTKQPRRQKLLSELFRESQKRRRIEDPMSSAVAIVWKVVQPKEKGGEGGLIGVLYAWRSMNSYLLMRLLEKSVV